ncbi:MAG: hypothetical protein P4M11_09715 [Candidatus Pacebacteria bacterium]|nr:hypothetical protein [Candidatus Paceibacterota bacterium]
MEKLPRVTRGKLLKVLRAFDEQRHKAPNTNIVIEETAELFSGTDEEPVIDECRVNVRFMYPNYEYLVRQIYGGSTITQGGLSFNAPSWIIQDEIQRMVNDGLIDLGEQWVNFYLIKENGEEELLDPKGWFPFPDDYPEYFQTKIILTTKGKSIWEYFRSQFPENATAWLAFLVSVLALLVSIMKP